jgi:four helix bundle protein
MVIKKFEDIIAWKKAIELAINIYKLLDTLNDYGFKDQICRASVSISNNIAEGFERSSKNDFKRFLYYSLGSCSEVKSMLYLADGLNYISAKDSLNLKEQCVEISKIITGFIKSLSK